MVQKIFTDDKMHPGSHRPTPEELAAGALRGDVRSAGDLTWVKHWVWAHDGDSRWAWVPAICGQDSRGRLVHVMYIFDGSLVVAMRGAPLPDRFTGPDDLDGLRERDALYCSIKDQGLHV